MEPTDLEKRLESPLSQEEAPFSLAENEQSNLARARALVNVELNLAKFASFIFAPSHTQEEARARSKSWVTSDPITNTKVLARIIVHTVDRQTLTTFDHRTSLALQKLWWERPRHEATGVTPLVLRDLARTMGLTWGKKTYLLLKASLRKLRHTPITWRYAFVDEATRKAIGEENTLTILEALRFLDRYQLPQGRGEMRPQDLTDRNADPHQAASAFRFHTLIEQNLLRRYTKPIFFEVAMGLRGEIALALYSFLDIVMADKTAWQRRVMELLRDDLHVRGKYRWPADWRRLIMRAIEELQGKAISTGTLKLAVVKTKDDQDYKLVVKKVPFKQRQKLPRPHFKETYLVDQILEVTGDEYSRPYYEQKVRELAEETIWVLLSETKQAHLEGRIQTSKARYFTDLVERHLGHREKQSGS